MVSIRLSSHPIQRMFLWLAIVGLVSMSGFLFVWSLLQPSASQAAGEIVSLELQDLTLSGCNTDIVQGSFRVVATDVDGVVANASTPVMTDRYYATSYNLIPQQHASTSGQVENFYIQFGGAAIVYATLSVRLSSNPQVVAPTYLLDCTTNTVSILSTGDDRINRNMGDLIAVLYNRFDSTGSLAIHVYHVDSAGKGYYIGLYPYADFEPYLTETPAENVEIDSVGATTLYALATGEFQINIGPDSEGKITSVIFDGLPAVKAYKRELHP